MLCFQGGACLRSSSDMFGQQVLETIGAQGRSTGTGENDVAVRSVSFLEPSFKHGGCLFRERGAALFSAFAVTADVRTTGQNNVSTPQANEFR